MTTAYRKPIPALSPTEIERFWASVQRGRDDECWPWLAGRFESGYGRFHIRRRPYRTHRIAYFLATGDDPGEALICHTCDFHPCCNNAHLFKGTNADNSADMAAKGRAASGDRNGSRLHPEKRQRGDEHWTRKYPERVLRGASHPFKLRPELVRRGEGAGNTKLTMAQVKEIRERHAGGHISYRQLARLYGVSKSMIGNIIQRNYWKHI